MATSSPLGNKVQAWPYEYKGWHITFNVVEKPLVAQTAPIFGNPIVEHLHSSDKQSVRWTKRKKVDLNDAVWGEIPVKDQLCCFICAVYMPDDVWSYFEKCKEMTRCVSVGNE